MSQPFKFGVSSSLIDDHRFAFAFDFDTPVTLSPHALRLGITSPAPRPMQPSHGVLMRSLSSPPAASSSSSQHQLFHFDDSYISDDSYIPPLPPLDSYDDPELDYLAPYHLLPDQMTTFYPEFSEPILPVSTGNDALLPLGAGFGDEPHRERIFEDDYAPIQQINEKGKRTRKGRAKQPCRDSDGSQTAPFEYQPSKRAKLVSHLNISSVHR